MLGTCNTKRKQESRDQLSGTSDSLRIQALLKEQKIGDTTI